MFNVDPYRRKRKKKKERKSQEVISVKVTNKGNKGKNNISLVILIVNMVRRSVGISPVPINQSNAFAHFTRICPNRTKENPHC